ncbi:MAG: SDR family NAD(P)-dependent oxidoreductase, partial [Dongiaceae bacterium]
MRLRGKVALITGGNSGIGRGIVHRFVAEDAKVAFAARDRQKGAAVLDEVKARQGEAAFFPVDLAREPAVETLIKDVADRFGRLDIV